MRWDQGVLLIGARIVAPNLLFVGMLITSVAYYEAAQSDAPTWRNVAAGSMALVGTLAGLGYRDFISRVRKFEHTLEANRKTFEIALEEDRKKRDDQHKANVAAIVALAMASASSEHMKDVDKDNIKEIVNRLLDSKVI